MLPITQPQDEKQDPEEVLRLAELEIKQLDLYREVFEKTHKYPELEYIEELDESKLTFYAVEGMAATGFMVSSVASAIYAAIRTAIIFAGAEYVLLIDIFNNSSIASSLSILAAVCILLGIEGFLFAWGYSSGVKSGKMNTNKAGLAIALLVSAFAGLISSFGFVPNGETKTVAEAIFYWLLAVISGPGISVLVWLGAENIGYLHNHWTAYVVQVKKKYKDDLKEAQKKYDEMVTEWERLLEEDYRTKGRMILFGGSNFTSSIRKQRVNTSDNVHQDVAKWLSDNFVSPHHVGRDFEVTPAMIADKIGADSGSVRTALSRLRMQIPAPINQ